MSIHLHSTLERMGILSPIITNIRSKNNIHLYRIATNGRYFVLKVFDKLDDSREISNYSAFY